MTTSVHDKIDSILVDWDHFKQVSEERDKAIAAKASTAELTEYRDRLDSAIAGASDKLESLRLNTSSKIDALEQIVAGYVKGKPVEDDKDYQRYAEQMSALVRRPVEAQEMRTYGTDFVNLLRTGQATAEMAKFRGLKESWGPSNAMQTQQDPLGGYWVPPDISGQMIEHQREYSDVRMDANVQVTSGDRLTGDRKRGRVAAQWLSETQAPTESSPTIGQWSVNARIMGTMAQDTHFNLQDSVRDVAGWLAQEIGAAFGLAEGESMVIGTDPLSPVGITTYPNRATEPGVDDREIEAINSGSTGGTFITSANAGKLIEVVGALKNVYQANAVWAVRRETLTQLRQLKTTDGVFYFVPDLTQSSYGTILGAPVRQWVHMPAYGTTNNVFALYGDLRRAYQIVDKPGMLMFQDPYTAQPNMKFIAYQRVGGDVVNFDALKFLKQAN